MADGGAGDGGMVFVLAVDGLVAAVVIVFGLVVVTVVMMVFGLVVVTVVVVVVMMVVLVLRTCQLCRNE